MIKRLLNRFKPETKPTKLQTHARIEKQLSLLKGIIYDRNSTEQNRAVAILALKEACCDLKTLLDAEGITFGGRDEHLLRMDDFQISLLRLCRAAFSELHRRDEVFYEQLLTHGPYYTAA